MTAGPRSLHELMDCVRGAMGGRGFLRLSVSKLEFAHACAAADALQDAEEALHDFHAQGSGVAGSYLRLYGVLQAAQIQQDCLIVLRQIFSMPDLDAYPKGMEAIRELRNRSIGHPTETDAKRRPKKPATAIARFSLEGHTLSVGYTEPSGQARHEQVALPQLLRAHSSDLLSLLADLVAEISRREAQFRLEQRQQREASGLLHSSWTYLLSKIRESVDDTIGLSASTIRIHASMLSDSLEKVVSGLADRALPQVLDWDITLTRRALIRMAELSEFLEDGGDASLDVYAYAELVEKQFKDIAAHLTSLDERLQEQS